MSPAPQTSRQDLMEAAALWLARLDSGSADMAEFEAWRSADPRHAAAFARVAAVTHRLDELKPLVPHAEKTSRGLRRRHIFTMAGLAAAVAGVATIGLVTARASASTRVGERKEVALPNGIKLDLNTDSHASWRFSGHAHQVWLERGEIALTVPSGSPMCELVGGQNVVRIGAGSVNARLRQKAMDVVVLSGECTASAMQTASSKRAADSTLVRAGEAALVGANGLHVRQVDSADLGFISGWRQGEVVLNGQTLDVAVAEYNRYLTRKIVIVDPQLGSIRLGGRFATHDPKDFLAALTSSFNVHVSQGGDGSVLLSK